MQTFANRHRRWPRAGGPKFDCDKKLDLNRQAASSWFAAHSCSAEPSENETGMLDGSAVPHLQMPK